MKELSTEQKAKRYDESLEQLKGLIESTREDKYAIVEEDIIDIFPELKESEEEKIRKTIIRFFKDQYSDETEMYDGSVTVGKAIAWLEKQGQEKHLSESTKDYQGSFTCWNNAHDFRPKHLQRCICYDKYMGGVYCYVYDDISKYWCTQTTEEHDSDGDNHICDYADYRITVWMPLPDTSFYPSKFLLEKQGKPKWTEEDEKIRKMIINHLTQERGSLSNEDAADAITWIENQGKQKVSVVDFKAKDWYVSQVDGKIYNAKFMEKNPTNQARKLEIEKAAMSATGIIEQEEWFIKGAEWADAHP